MSHHEAPFQGPIVADLKPSDLDELRLIANGVTVINENFRSRTVSLTPAQLEENRQLRDRIVEDLYLGQIRGKLISIGIGEGVDVAPRDSLPEGVSVLGNGQMQDWPIALVAKEGFNVTTEITKPRTAEQGLRFTVVRQAPPAQG